MSSDTSLNEFDSESRQQFKKKAKDRVQFSTHKLIGRKFECDNDVKKFMSKLESISNQNYFQRDKQPKEL